MSRQSNALFLEKWLSTISGEGSSNIPRTSQFASSSLTSSSIIQSWADLRECLHSQTFQPRHLESMTLLQSSQDSLYVADPQAKLLLAILSKITLPSEAYPLLLRLLYVWIMKSSRPSPMLIDSAAEVITKFVDNEYGPRKDPVLFSNAVLLMGSLSYVPSASERSKTVFLTLVCRLLEEDYRLSRLVEALLPNVLAGIGYALCSSVNVHYRRVLDSLMGIWGKDDGPSRSIPNGLMILHLVEWVIPGIMKLGSQEKLETFTREVLETRKPDYPPFALVMTAGGVLRALARSVSGGQQLDLVSRLRTSSENVLESTAQDLLARSGGVTCSNSLLLHCISLALARAGSVSPRVPLLMSLATALLTDIFPLRHFYKRILTSSVSSPELELNEVNNHLISVSFKEAGAISAVFCNQYASADIKSKETVENAVWSFCQEIYSKHRRVAFLLRGREGHQLLGNLEKIAESVFLMVAVFALTVSKHKLSSSFSLETLMETSVSILVSFSCMEYFRRVRLAEYMDTIRGVVVSVQENETACASFVQSMPSYVDLTNPKDFPQQMQYNWLKDEVQTSRILFYLRVIPTCVERLPADLFSEVVAPTMFLYLEHPNSKIARASHSMFVAFISLGNESEGGGHESASLKEQLAFYYVQKSLSVYPGATPFDGMASGFAHLVQNLPAGSPATFYCIHSLIEKAHELSSNVDAAEPCKKLFDMLLRFISLVDIQVLPYLMKQLAQLTIQLPKDVQNSILDELYEHVAESDDVIRKPSLVSWLQSLSYVCSRDNSTSRGSASKETGAAKSAAAEGISSRL